MRRHLSIRNYLILMNLVLLCLLFPATGFLFLQKTASFRDTQLNNTIEQMEKSLENRSATMVRSMSLSASQAISGYDFSFLLDLVGEVTRNDPEILYCIVMDQKQKAVAHSNREKVGSHLTTPADNKVGAMLRKYFPTALGQTQTIPARFLRYTTPNKHGTEHIMETIVPIYNGAVLWGVIRCGYSLTPLKEKIGRTRKDWASQMRQLKLYFLTTLGFFFSIGVLVAAYFTRSFVHSTLILKDGVNKVAAGNLDYEISKNNLAFTEFVSLATSFNTMTEKLRWSRQKIDEYSFSLEEKVAERTKELREAQEIMLKQAHEAGMAELAVGVLHNIGNAITPAKVGCAMLLKQLSESPLRNDLAKALEPLDRAVEQNPGFPPPDKKRVKKIIQLIPAGIKEEYDHSIAEIKKIRKMHDHIENVITLQMRYAQLVGDPETINLNLVIQDALQMLAESIRRRKLIVETNFTAGISVKLEETKILQIMVNLIKNSYEAMDVSNNPEKKLIITTSLEMAPHPVAMVSVKDNGCGFAPENKDRFFTYGFSTKERGSGFGLHSCANYLIANHGSIEAISAGPGQGAEFIIRLPVDKHPHDQDGQPGD